MQIQHTHTHTSPLGSDAALPPSERSAPQAAKRDDEAARRERPRTCGLTLSLASCMCWPLPLAPGLPCRPAPPPAPTSRAKSPGPRITTIAAIAAGLERGRAGCTARGARPLARSLNARRRAASCPPPAPGYGPLRVQGSPEECKPAATGGMAWAGSAPPLACLSRLWSTCSSPSSSRAATHSETASGSAQEDSVLSAKVLAPPPPAPPPPRAAELGPGNSAACALRVVPRVAWWGLACGGARGRRPGA